MRKCACAALTQAALELLKRDGARAVLVEQIEELVGLVLRDDEAEHRQALRAAACKQPPLKRPIGYRAAHLRRCAMAKRARRGGGYRAELIALQHAVPVGVALSEQI